MKTLKQGAMTKDDFLKEAKIMKNMNHPKLVKLFAVCTEEPIYIVTELMNNGSLLTYLREGEGQYLQLPPLVDMMTQVNMSCKSICTDIVFRVYANVLIFVGCIVHNQETVFILHLSTLVLLVCMTFNAFLSSMFF